VLLSDERGREMIPSTLRVDTSAIGARPWSAIKRVRHYLKAERPDVVLSLQTHPNICALLAVAALPKASRPVVAISERNLVSLGLPSAGISHRAKIRAAKWLYRRADRMIAISHPVAGEMVSAFGVPGGRCVVVPNPATAKVAVRTTGFAGTRDPLRIVVPGRIVSQKRPLLAVRVAHAVAARGIETELITFGTGELEREMTSLASDLAVRVDHRGWVEKWFESAPTDGIVLLPSDREGFGNVLVEAAAMKLPAVAVSGALGVADAVVPGLTGELALDDRPESIADAVVAASQIQIGDIRKWLHRFSVESSGSLLEETMIVAYRDKQGA
jgi:glycosyltransferase involved in cell wall biosynthesis